MKKFILSILTFSIVLFSSGQNIPAGTYTWPIKLKKNDGILSGSIVKGSANILKALEVNAYSLSKNQTVNFKDDYERILFIRFGDISINMRDSVWSLGRGSVVVVYPQEKVTVTNSSNEDVLLHEMLYQAKEAYMPASVNGASFVRDWSSLTLKLNERGGVRSFFNQPTAMSKRFEMHVTTLRANTSSHEPHTHNAEEIILMLEGEGEMLIGDKHYKAKAGDLFFVPTQLFHGIKNIGSTQCSYYAYQWE